MSKLTKISGICGSIILIMLDVWGIFNSFALNGVGVFSNIFNNMIPCGLLLGGLALITIHNETPKKSLSIASLVLFAITAFIRIAILVLYVLELIYATYLAPLTATEYLDLVKFVAYGLLAVAVIFLMIYLIKGKYPNTSLALCGIANLTLCVAWVINIYTLVTEAVSLSSGVFEVIIAFFKGGLAKDIVIILAYMAVFWVLTTIMKNKEKA